MRLHAMLALWLLVVVGAMAGLVIHKAQPGAVAPAPECWPAATKLTRSLSTPTLVLFAHPQCPCTRASLVELGAILQQDSSSVAVYVVVAGEKGDQAGCCDSPSASALVAPRGAKVVFDAEGTEARRFGALTSGHTVLYDCDGRLRFQGGITGLRGHQGDNQGRAIVEAILAGRAVSSAARPTLGCSLFDTSASKDDQR